MAYRVEVIDISTEAMEDELWEPILFLPTNPGVATVLDSLAVKPNKDSGEWEPPERWGKYLIAPLLTVAINAYYVSQW